MLTTDLKLIISNSGNTTCFKIETKDNSFRRRLYHAENTGSRSSLNCTVINLYEELTESNEHIYRTVKRRDAYKNKYQ